MPPKARNAPKKTAGTTRASVKAKTTKKSSNSNTTVSSSNVSTTPKRKPPTKRLLNTPEASNPPSKLVRFQLEVDDGPASTRNSRQMSKAQPNPGTPIDEDGFMVIGSSPPPPPEPEIPIQWRVQGMSKYKKEGRISTNKTFLSILDIELECTSAITGIVGSKVDYEIQEVLVSVSDEKRKAPKQGPVTLSNDFKLSDEALIIGLIDRLFTVNSNAMALVNLYVKFVFDEKAKAAAEAPPLQLQKEALVGSDSHILQDSSPITPKTVSRRTAINMVETLSRRAAAQAAAGNIDAELVNKWTCSSDDCLNKSGYCYRLLSGEHYAIKMIDIQAWGNEIKAGSCDIERPTEAWFARIVRNGAIGETKRPLVTAARKSNENRLREMQERIAEMELKAQEERMKQLEASRLKQMEDEIRLKDLQMRREMKQLESELMREEIPIKPEVGSALILASNPLKMASLPFEELDLPSSSPVDAAVDEGDVIIDFFEWKLEQITHAIVKSRWEKARDVVIDNDWRVAELKALSHASAPILKLAIDQGMSRNLALKLKADYDDFKKARRAANILKSLQV
jgi:hypothetical protein